MLSPNNTGFPLDTCHDARWLPMINRDQPAIVMAGAASRNEGFLCKLRCDYHKRTSSEHAWRSAAQLGTPHCANGDLKKRASAGEGTHQWLAAWLPGRMAEWAQKHDLRLQHLDLGLAFRSSLPDAPCAAQARHLANVPKPVWASPPARAMSRAIRPCPSPCRNRELRSLFLAGCRLQTAGCRLQIADCEPGTANCWSSRCRAPRHATCSLGYE